MADTVKTEEPTAESIDKSFDVSGNDEVAGDDEVRNTLPR